MSKHNKQAVLPTKLKKNDEVIVIAGRDKGKRGDVQKVLKDGRLIVSGVNMIKKHERANPNIGQQGGIVSREAPIQASNVMIWNGDEGKADRIGYIFEDDRKVRVFRSTQKPID